MNELDYKIGDKCIILKRPSTWASLLGGSDPTRDFDYPKNIIITKLEKDNTYMAMSCKDFGWDLSYLIKENIITINNKIYESKKLKF